ncbi:TIGR04255 family protein [Microbacterium sp. p3-SID131]|uniref:TIGR04255 family protein n=1 Tax=Microbacterium sp. p3-SID131 TaxID=2916215 RepID=UPI0021A33E85|nr:TIGR04255 family protein [Microbacterium sp. p3-SID131]MCT1364075.1 TIGR04255 family protein [Microbacterium sp. p3-SID131]
MSQVEGPYPSAPIVEAGLTLAFAEQTVFNVDALSRRFDARSPEWEAQGIFDVSGTYVPVAVGQESTLGDDRKLVGFQRSRDKERLQFIEDEIRYVRTYRKNLYTDWNDFIADAMEHLVPLFSDNPDNLVMFAQARFVNELPIPKSGRYEISDWVYLGVDVPSELPQGVSRMFTQVDIPFDREDTGFVNTRSTVFAGARENEAVLVLDIEVSKQFPPRSVNGLEDILTVLRSVKNELFEGAVTDGCRTRMRGAPE